MVRTAAVAAVACALASCGPGSTTTATTTFHQDDPNAPRRAAYVLTETAGIALTASDDHFLYWVDTSGLKRRAHGGPDEKIELISDQLPPEYTDATASVMVVVGDRGYILRGSTVTTISLIQKGEKPEPLVTMPNDVNAITVATDGSVYLASAGQVLAVAAGKDPKVVADRQGVISDIIVDDKFVYIATNAVDPNAQGLPQMVSPYYTQPVIATSTGALRKVPRDGGKVTELAGQQPLPGALAVYDHRLWWNTTEGPAAVTSIDVDGGELRVEARGRATALAVDAGGLVYRQNNQYAYTGMIVERRNDALQVDFVPDGTFSNNTPQPIVLSPDWTYITTTRSATGTPAILALPRQTEPVQVAFDLDRVFSHLVVEDDAVYWAELTRDMDGTVHLMRGDSTDGARRELGSYQGSAFELAVGGGQVYVDDNYTISSVSTAGGEVRTLDRSDGSYVVGLQLHRNHLYWFDGSSLWARKRRGGTPFVVARNDTSNGYGGYGYGYGYYGGQPGGDLVFDDDFVYTTGFGQGGSGVYQISERGKVKMLWDAAGGSTYPGKDLVMLGDQLFFTTGQGGPVTVMRVTTDGEAEAIFHARSDGYGTDLIDGGGLLYLLVTNGGYCEVTRIDPSTGEGQVVFRFYQAGSEYPTLGADSHGVYLGMDAYDAIFRIAHDAPAVPETGWPRDAE